MRVLNITMMNYQIIIPGIILYFNTNLEELLDSMERVWKCWDRREMKTGFEPSAAGQAIT